jgi:hypothetical protein
MTRAWIVATLTVLWLAIGGFGIYGHGANDYQYRGFPPPRDLPGVRAPALRTLTFDPAAPVQARKYDVHLRPGRGLKAYVYAGAMAA